MRDRAEPSVVDAALQLPHVRMKAARIGDPEHDPGPRHGVERPRRASPVEGERLFHEDVLAGGGGALDLRPVLAVRRREHDRVDLRIGEDLVETVGELQAVLGAERLGIGAGAVVSGGEAEFVALALHRADQRSAPPSYSDHRRTDHAPLPA